MQPKSGKFAFEEELAWFIENQARLISEYRGGYLAIRGQEVVGVYSTPLDAYLETQKNFPPGTVMIQRCAPGPDAYTVTVGSPHLEPLTA